MVYLALFGLGHVLIGPFWEGIGLLAVSAICAGALYSNISRSWGAEVSIVICHLICHPERSWSIRFANRPDGVEGPLAAHRTVAVRRSAAFDACSPKRLWERVEVLRLRVCFAKRSKLSAQDDRGRRQDDEASAAG